MSGRGPGRCPGHDRPLDRPGSGFSSPGWTRTNNPPINSRMLCQLSYRGTVLGEARNCSGALDQLSDGRADFFEGLLELFHALRIGARELPA